MTEPTENLPLATVQPISRKQPDASALSVITHAIEKGATPETMRELLAVRREWEADEARKAFNLSLADFQRQCPIIPKEDKAYDKMYARMDRIWRTIRPISTPLGLTVTWQVCELREGNIAHVEGTLAHEQGHGQPIRMDVPLPARITNSSGKELQNAAQQMGSAFTYAQRYAFCAALGVVTGDDDDDGAGAGAEFISELEAKQVSELLAACEGLAEFDKAKFWRWAGVTNVREITGNRLADVLAALRAKLAKK